MSIRDLQQDGLNQRHLNAPRSIVRPQSNYTPGTQYPWVRNPSWLALPSIGAGVEKFAGLYQVWNNSDNFIAFTASGAYTVDWGDGGATENVAAGVSAYHTYSWSDTDFNGTDGAVTFTDATDLVTRSNHGYANGNVVQFYNIVTTTGLTQGQIYYVINATTNTFQVSTTYNGSAVALTNDGTGSLLPYKQAIVTIVPQAGQNLTALNLNVLHNQSGLATGYSTGWLDIAISMPNCSSTGLVLGLTSPNVRFNDLEQVKILNGGSLTSAASLFNSFYSLQSVSIDNSSSISDATSMFSSCTSMQSAPMFNTSSVTNMGSMFISCRMLQYIPLLNTASVTSMSSMFNSCSSLQSVPLFNTASVTDMGSMFSNCLSLQSVPLLNTASVASMTSMFGTCRALQSVPLFNTASVTNMSAMFSNCSSLTSVPLFNTASATDINSMFSGCSALVSVPLFNTANVTNASGLLLNCFNLKYVPLFNLSANTTFQGFLQGCSSLASVPLFNTSAATTFGSMVRDCKSLKEVPAFSVAAATSSSSYSNIFTGCSALNYITMAPQYTFSVASCQLSSTALDALYTALPTVTGQTITVTGNYGTSGDNPSIATAKGWTVTG